jgi:hypothetical protein
MLRSFLYHTAGALTLAALTLGWSSTSDRVISPVEKNAPAEQVFELVSRLTPVRAETLSYVIQAGEVLIFSLPENLGQRKIEAYRIKDAPALSWLVKRSFFWRTLPKDAGQHDIKLEALVNGSAVEDVLVQVDIR